MTRQIDFAGWGGENFCNFIEPVSMKVDPGKIVLITGPNGIGKTTLFEILSYVLYGVTSKGLKGEDVVNERTLENCFTWGEFAIGEDKYRTERYCKHKKFKNNVVLYKNDFEQPFKVGHTEVRAEIDRVFMPHKLFMNIFFFSQKVKSFFTELQDADQKEIFRKVLGLDDYVFYYKEVSKRYDLAESEVTKVKNNQIVTTKLIEDCGFNIVKLERLKTEFYEKKEKEIAEIMIDISLLENKVSGLEFTLAEFPEEIFQKDLGFVNQKISDIENRKRLIEVEYEKKKTEISMKKNEKVHLLTSEMMEKEKEETKKMNDSINFIRQCHNDEALSHSKEVAEINQAISSLKSEIEKNGLIASMALREKQEIEKNVFEKSISVCPTCYQEISDEIKEKLKDKVKELNDKYVSLINKNSENGFSAKELFSKLDRRSDKFTEKVKELTQRTNKIKEDFQGVLIDLKSRLSVAFKKLDEIELAQVKVVEGEMIKEQSALPPVDKLLEERNSLALLIEKSKKIQSEISNVKSVIEVKKGFLSYKEAEQFDESQIISSKQRLSKLYADLAILSQELSELEVKMKRYTIVKKMFSPTGIPSMLIDDSVPFINETVSKYLEQISGGRYVVSFDTVRETKGGELRDKIGINVLDTVTLASSRAKLSGGQTRIIDIATILTLASLQSVMRDVKINLMLFDEIFDSLDDNNITYVARVLKTVASDKAIFIISHRHIDLIEADEVIRLEG
jgi:DNA repair exonuclease SbcCD ATPase subunit